MHASPQKAFATTGLQEEILAAVRTGLDFAEAWSRLAPTASEDSRLWKLVRSPLGRALGPFRAQRLLAPVMSGSRPYTLEKLQEGVQFVGGRADMDTLLWVTEPSFNRGLINFIAQSWKQSPGRIVDVGSNLGVLSAMVAKATGSPTDIIAMEANPKTADLAAATWSLNGMDGIRLVTAAASDHNGELEFTVAATHSGGATAGKPKARGRMLHFKAPCYRIDDVLDTLDAGSVSVLKVDVEGFESEALHGAEKTIRRHRPVIVFEHNKMGRSRGHDLDHFRRTLEKWGAYSLHKLEAGADLPILQPAPEIEDDCDLVAVPHD